MLNFRCLTRFEINIKSINTFMSWKLSSWHNKQIYFVDTELCFRQIIMIANKIDLAPNLTTFYSKLNFHEFASISSFIGTISHLLIKVEWINSIHANNTWLSYSTILSGAPWHKAYRFSDGQNSIFGKHTKIVLELRKNFLLVHRRWKIVFTTFDDLYGGVVVQTSFNRLSIR